LYDKDIILRKIDHLTLTTDWWRKCSVGEVFTGIHGESLVACETEGGGTCICAPTPKSEGEQGECEVFG